MYVDYKTVYPDVGLQDFFKDVFGETGGYVHIAGPACKDGIYMPARSMQDYPDLWKTSYHFQNCVTGTKFSLATFTGKKKTKATDINSVTAFQVQLDYDFPMELPVGVLARFDELVRQYGDSAGLYVPRPTYAILADGLTFIYVLEHPFILNASTPKKRGQAYKFLVRVVKGLVDRINWLDPRFGAVFSRLTLKAPVPGSLERNWFYMKGAGKKGEKDLYPYFSKVYLKKISGEKYPIQGLADNVLRMTRENYENRKKIKRKKPAVSLKGQVIMDVLHSFDPSADNYIRNEKIKYRSLSRIMEDRARLIRKLAASCEDGKRSGLTYLYADTLLTQGYTDVEIFGKLKVLNRMFPRPLPEAHLCCQIPGKVYKYQDESFLKALGISEGQALRLGYPVSYFQTNKAGYHCAYSRLYRKKKARKRNDKKLSKIEKAQKLRKEGLTLKQIAKSIDVCLRTVSNYMKVKTGRAALNLSESAILRLGQSLKTA